MKHINLSGMAALALLALFAGCMGVKQGADKGQTLTAPPAPFAAKEIVKGFPEIGKINTMIRGPGGTAAVTQELYGVTCGGNSLTVKPGESMLHLSLNGGQRQVLISYWGTTSLGYGEPGPFKGNAAEISCAGPEITIVKKFHAASEKETDGIFTEVVKLLDDGLVNVKCSYKIPAGAKITDKGFFFSFMPFDAFAGMKCVIDGKEFAFSGSLEPLGQREIFKGNAESMDFSPDHPENGFRVVFPVKTYTVITETRLEKNNPWKYCVHIRAAPGADGSIEFKLDMRNTSGESVKSADTFAGINFWKDDRLHIPNYGKCRNLAQNSSFEAGLRYYQIFETWAHFRERTMPVFSVDENVSKFGNCSLKINVFKEDKAPGFLQTFAIPVSAGKKYTVSFFAKGNRKGGIWLDHRCVTGVWLQFPKVPGFVVAEDWKRYSFTVTAPNNALTHLLTALYSGNDPSGMATVWIDGLQIEEGETATDYVEKPLNAILLTSNPDNFMSVDDKEINARLKITAPANTEGSVECGMEDYFYKNIWKQKFDFKTDAKGIAVVNLPMEKLLGTGVYVLRADFALKDGYKDTDYFRISRMKFLNNTHKNKDIFGTGMSYSGSRSEDILKRCRAIGFGSTRAAGKSKEFNDMAARYGISVVYYYLLYGDPVMKVEGVDSLKTIDKLTPELEKKIEAAAYEMAKAHPWVDRWAVYSEVEGWALVRNGNYKDFAKLQIACYKGIKRFDPGKKYILGGSCNMQPQNGTRYVGSYLEAANEVDSKIKFDGVTIHPYRTTPESPDLDDDAAVFFAVLDKNGYQDVPAYWDEGIYYPHYNIPAWGLDPHKGCSSDHYRAGCPSYHMGWGERISAAYCARSWLVALKYQDRVRRFIGHELLNMDAYLDPSAVHKIPNTLGNLLGNASFKKDIRFAPDIRCYVFEDENKRPIAAIWSHDPKVDRGYEPSPTARFNFKGESLELFDLMENKHSLRSDAQGFSDIPVTPFPIFIRGSPGALESLCQSMQNGRVLDSNKAVIQLSAKPLNATELDLSCRNLVTREVKGKADIRLQDQVVGKDIALAPKGSADITIPLPEKIPFDKIAGIRLPVTFTEEGVKPFEMNLSFEVFAVRKLKGKITSSGNADEWNEIPSIRITNRYIAKSTGGTKNIPIDEKVGYPGDLEAEYQMAWDDESLYLRVKVTDDVFHHNANKNVGGRCDNDSLQIYIDTLCDARGKETRGFDGNDYNYDFYPNMTTNSTSVPDGTITAFRRYAPEQQAAGGLFAPMPNMVEPDIKGAFTKTDKGYTYEVAIPRRLVAPLQLKSGSVSGFAIFLPDHDGKCVKGALSLTPPGTGGYMNPHLYPVMLLVE